MSTISQVNAPRHRRRPSRHHDFGPPWAARYRHRVLPGQAPRSLLGWRGAPVPTPRPPATGQRECTKYVGDILGPPGDRRWSQVDRAVPGFEAWFNSAWPEVTLSWAPRRPDSVVTLFLAMCYEGARQPVMPERCYPRLNQAGFDRVPIPQVPCVSRVVNSAVRGLTRAGRESSRRVRSCPESIAAKGRWIS